VDVGRGSSLHSSSSNMVPEFLRTAKNGKAMKLAVFGPASAEVRKMIQTLWSLDHTIFSILPNRGGYLTHFLAEGRFDGLLFPASLSDRIREDAMSASRCLGIPALKFSLNRCSDRTHSQLRPRIMVESQSKGSSVPRIKATDPSQWMMQIEFNKQLLGNGSTVLPMSRNWLLDAESLDPVFQDNSSIISPSMVIIDQESAGDFVKGVESRSISVKNLERIIFDAPMPDDTGFRMNRSILRRLERFDLPVHLRYMSPELGRFGDLVPIKEALQDQRDASVQSSSWPHGTASRTDNTRRIGKRRVMAADWRVRKVPLAVYHKKRGFKGQIYYTTKHKGWTLYRSRYYN
jgi:hypothetical protein